MAFTYSEFITAPGASGATVVAAIKAAVLASTNWSNPTGQVLQCTAQNGATMAVDLVGGGAADNTRLRPIFYQAFSGGTGTGALQRSLYWNRGAGNVAGNLRCRVAAGNTLLYIEIEGPRPAELGADSAANGSQRQELFLAQLTPYLTADTTPVVVLGGGTSIQGSESAQAQTGCTSCHVSRNQANTASWVSARLMTLTFPVCGLQTNGFQQRPQASDGNVWLSPYVVFEDSSGIRGRLADLFWTGGWVNSADTGVTTNLGDGTVLSYGGNTYKVTTPYRTEGNNSNPSYGSLGAVSNQGPGVNNDRSPLVAIRTA